MKTISISLYNRPEYTQKVLSNLDQCFDIDNYNIFICCEPGNNHVIDLAKSFRSNQTSVIINPQRYGCNLNIFQCLSIGFHFNDFHIHLEDDTVPAKDFLVYCEWCRNQFKDDQSVYSVCGYNKSRDDIPKITERSLDPSQCVKKVNWFTPWGWATWSNRWNSIIKQTIESSLNNPASWDTFVHKSQKDKYEIVPIIARTQNIGAENGTYCPGPAWHRENQFNEFWIESTKEYKKDFLLYE